MRFLRVRTAAVGLLAIGLTTSLAVVTATGPEVAVAAPTAKPSPLRLEAARRAVTTFGFDGQAFLDLGIYAVADNAAFEVRARRPSYSAPIKAWQVKPGPDVVLPRGAVRDFAGLTDFYRLTIKDAKHKSALDTRMTFCPNTFNTVRRRPDAPATSPYPDGCFASPYSTGAVWGIQRGYGAQALEGVEAPLQPGTYSATLAITPKYRAALGIRPADASATVTLTVVAAPVNQRQASVTRQVRPVSAPSASESVGQLSRTARPKGPLPDLRSLPAWAITVDEGRFLRFSATVWNAGPSPLVVDGFRRVGNEDLMDAYQYFIDARGRQVGYAPAGSMEWDPRDGHEHWHFTDFASYRLLDAHKKLVVRSEKEAFCLANTDAVDYTVKHANWRPQNTDLHTACGDRNSIGVREVLDTGSGDTYVQSLPGQSFDLTHLKNGVYYIEVRANPAGRLFESSTGNNVSYRQVRISGVAGDRKVTARKVGIIVEPPVDSGDPGGLKAPRP